MPGAAAVDELERAEVACRAAGATDVVRAADAQEADWLRQARRAAHYALERLGDVRMEDVGVPRSRVPDMLRAIERDRREARRPDRDVRARRRRQPPPGPRLRARRPERRGEDRGGPEGPLPGRHRPRRHGHRRARHRVGPARLARAPARRRCGPGDARDQDRPRPAGHPQPGTRPLGDPARRRDTSRGQTSIRRVGSLTAVGRRSAMMPGPCTAHLSSTNVHGSRR